MANSLNIPMLQSEHGVTGEASPNLEPIWQLANQLKENFLTEEDGSVTANDCFLLLSWNRIGMKLNGREGVQQLVAAVSGCPSDLVMMLSGLIKKEPNYENIFLAAIEESQKTQ